MLADKDIAKQLFSQVQRKPVTGDHVVDPTKLDFVDDPDAAVGLFCTGCGSYHALTKLGASSFIEILGVERPADLSGHYFEASRCTACADDFVVMALRDTPRQ